MKAYSPKVVISHKKNKFNNFPSVYHVHVRKTAGTSINKMFLELDENPDELYKKIAEENLAVGKKHVYAGWSKRIIEAGNYHYAFSHIPYHELNLKKRTFCFTCLRDPIKRLISLYNMLTYYHQHNIPHPGMETQREWLGQNFSDFLELIPKTELFNQLYMFSSNFNVDEGLENLSKLDLVMSTERLKEALPILNKTLGVNLKYTHVRKSKNSIKLTDREYERLRNILAIEYNFYNQAQLLSNFVKKSYA